MENFNKQYAVRFIHSTVDNAVPLDQALLPKGLGINVGDGTVYTTDPEGNTIPLTGSRSLQLDRYVGHGRPIKDDLAPTDELNAGDLNSLEDVVNHLYYHTLSYVPPVIDRRLDYITVDAGTLIRLEGESEPVDGINKVTLQYIDIDTHQPVTAVYHYTLDINGREISPLRLRHRCIEGGCRFVSIDLSQLESPNYVPQENDFVPNDGSVWVIELVHDFGETESRYEDGNVVGHIRVEVRGYV